MVLSDCKDWTDNTHCLETYYSNIDCTRLRIIDLFAEDLFLNLFIGYFRDLELLSKELRFFSFLFCLFEIV